jgi:hypothetical protein
MLHCAAHCAAQIAVCVLAAACGFADLRPIEIATYPARADVVLPDVYQEVAVRFNTPVKRIETQNMVKVSWFEGFVEGDCRWDGTTVWFKPQSPWLPGTRYVLQLAGTVAACDGREEQVDIAVPFYVLTTVPAPYIRAFSPADGESVHPADGTIRLEFSAAMNRASVEEHFSLDHEVKPVFLWEGDAVLQVHVKETYTPFAVYTWALSKKAVSAAGVPMARAESGRFVVNGDTEIPYVEYVYTARRGAADGGYALSDVGLLRETGLAKGCGIGVRFSKSMNAEKVRGAVSVQPPLSGRLEQIAGNGFVYIPEKDPEPECSYRLTVGAEAACAAGIKMREEYSETFVSAIPYLAVREIVFSSGSGGAGSGGEKTLSGAEVADGALVRIAAAAQRDFTVRVRWSEWWTEAAQSSAVRGITLAPFFPGTLEPLVVTSVKWTSASDVMFSWQGVAALSESEAAAGRQKFYKLLIPGGGQGLQNGEGSYLKTSLALYIEVVNK